MKEHQDPRLGVVDGGAKDHPFEGKGLFGLSCLGFGLFSSVSL